MDDDEVKEKELDVAYEAVQKLSNQNENDNNSSDDDNDQDESATDDDDNNDESNEENDDNDNNNNDNAVIMMENGMFVFRMVDSSTQAPFAFDAGINAVGFDGKKGYAEWNASHKISSSSSTSSSLSKDNYRNSSNGECVIPEGVYWIFAEFASEESRPLQVWSNKNYYYSNNNNNNENGDENDNNKDDNGNDQDNDEKREDKRLLPAAVVAADVSGSFDPEESIQWFHYGPFSFQDPIQHLRIDSKGYWPHVRQFVLVPSNLPPIDAEALSTCGSSPSCSSSNASPSESHGGDDGGSSDEREVVFPEPQELQCNQHAGVEAMLQEARRRQKEQEIQAQKFVAILKKPTHTTDNVEVDETLIVVDGNEGSYGFEFNVDFDVSSSESKVFFDVTYASGDTRPVAFTLNDQLLVEGVCASATGGYDPENAISERLGPFVLDADTNVLTVTTSQDQEGGGYFPHILEIRVVMEDNSSEEEPTPYTTDCNWIVPPSSPLRDDLKPDLMDFTRFDRTQEPNPDFFPDPDFYNAINADGLWITASKEVDERILQRAAELMCRYIPVELRRLFSLWRAPLDAPRGPMRLVILDNKTEQQAGDCPDFPDDWEGRNGTSNPGCFTSADDLVPGGGNGELTIHEMMHALDMVIRQQVDPYFMQEVDDCWRNAVDANTYKKAYAAADRHEYLAEICTLFVNCIPDNFRNGCHGCSEAESGTCDFPAHQDMPPGKGEVDFTIKSDLQSNDPGGYQLLQKYLVEIKEPEDDSPWWEN